MAKHVSDLCRIYNDECLEFVISINFLQLQQIRRLEQKRRQGLQLKKRHEIYYIIMRPSICITPRRCVFLSVCLPSAHC